MYTHIYLYIYICHTIKIEEESIGKRYIKHQIARWLNGLRHQGNGELRAEQCQWTSRWPKADALKLCELKLHSPVTQCQMTMMTMTMALSHNALQFSHLKKEDIALNILQNSFQLWVSELARSPLSTLEDTQCVFKLN